MPRPELEIDKPAPVNAAEDGSGDISVGDTLTYTITATNTGDANLTNVGWSNTLCPDGTDSGPSGGTCPGWVRSRSTSWARTPSAKSGFRV